MRSHAVLIATLGLAAFSPCALAQTLPATTMAGASSTATMPASPPSPATQAAVAATAPATQAAAPTRSPGSRILHNFDFEETKFNNYESIPMFWRKVKGRGFPAFAAGAFDRDIFRPDPDDAKARTSFRLDIDSGSAAFRYLAPYENAIHINPNADYYVFGWVKTTPLQFARAEVRAWFADDTGNVLPGTEMHSERYASSTDPANATPPDAAEWHVLRLFVPGPHPNTPEANAKTLVLQLGLLQPQQLSGDGAAGAGASEGTSAENPLGKFALYQQDIKGSAWFDDFMVYQLPRITVEVPAAITANIFEPKQPIDLDLTVADLANHPKAPSLGVSLKITDPDGLVFATEKWDVRMAPGETWEHRYTHAHLPPALYTATLEVMDGVSRTLIARRQTKFLSLADLPVGLNAAGTERTGPRFGMTATRWPVDCWSELPAMARTTTVGLMQIAAWRQDMTENALHTQDPAFDSLLNALQRVDTHVLGSFAEVPDVLAARIGEDKSSAGGGAASRSAMSSRVNPLLALADADPALWRPYASFLLARYSNFVDAWEVGSPETPFSGVLAEAHVDGAVNGKDRFPDLYSRMYGQLAGLLSKPRLVIPWNALFDFDVKSYPHAILDLRIPNVIKPMQITSYVHNFEEAARPVDSPAPAKSPGATVPETPMYVHVDPLEEASYARTDRLSDFAQRVVFARSTNPIAVMVDLPLERTTPISSGATHSEPDELLLVYRTLVRTLGTATYRREISIAPGVRAFLFVRNDADGNVPASDANHEGILALWNESATDPVVPADLPLGDMPRAVELNGFTHPLAVDPNSRMAHLNVSTVPSMITFVDAHLVELRASFSLTNSNLPAGAGVMQTEVHLTNPYNEPLSGNIKLNPPPGWTIDSPTLPMNIPPGGTFTQRITIRYPYTEGAGAKLFNATLTSDGGPGSGGHPLQLSFPVAVKSDSVDTEGFARLLPNGDLVVQQMITNISSVPLNAEAYALVPGYARQQHFVVNLPPGQTTIKRFLFPMAGNVDYTKKMTPADVGALLANKFATVGLRQNTGKTLITKSFSLN